jgi:hypothetical protein
VPFMQQHTVPLSKQKQMQVQQLLELLMQMDWQLD